MSYSCLNMDDLNDQFNLETVNLCLKTENIELETDQIPGITLLNNFLLSFDLFRGSFFDGNLTGYYIPFIQSNILNGDLYANTNLPYTDQMIYLYNFFLSYYELALTDISVFSSLNTRTYIIAKELGYSIDIVYFPNIRELINAGPTEGPKGVFRRSLTKQTNDTTIFLDSVEDIEVGMYFRGPTELDNGGDFPITDPALLPVVVSIDIDNTSVQLSIATNVDAKSLILFGFPEFCSFNRPGTGEYPDDSYSFIIRMKNNLQDLLEYLEREVTFETINTKTGVNTTINVFEFTDLNGVTVDAPAETLVPGVTYRFDQTAASNRGRPLQFSITSDGTHAGGDPYTDNVTTVGTPGFSEVAYTEITVTQDTPDVLYYFSPNFPDMGNVLTIVKGFVTPELESVTLLENNNINVTYNFAYNNTDWVGFYKEGELPGTNDADLWLYVGGSKTPTTTGTGSILFDQSSEGFNGTFPLPSGNYVIYFFQSDVYKSYGKPLTLTIQ